MAKHLKLENLAKNQANRPSDEGVNEQLKRIYLFKNGEQVGPFSAEEIRSMVLDGRIGQQDPAWHEGLAEWSTVSAIVPPSIPASTPSIITDNSQPKKSVVHLLFQIGCGLLTLYIISIIFTSVYAVLGGPGLPTPESKVKNGVLPIDKSVTVGKAFDNYKYFSKKNWSTGKAKNDRIIVQFSGVIDFSTIDDMELGTSVAEAQGMKILSNEAQKAGADFKKAISNSTKSVELIVQFQVNKDETFELYTTVYRQISNDGEKSPDIPLNSMLQSETLGDIYQDKLAATATGIALLGLSTNNAVKSGGPPDDVVRTQVDWVFNFIGDTSKEKIDFQITNIIRGEILESEGARGIPTGTLLYPIKSLITFKKGTEASEPQPLELIFYKDSYGEWHAFAKK